jgi:UDP-galactopyranose mutase
VATSKAVAAAQRLSAGRNGSGFDWLIVGAGLSGVTIAERLASQLDQKVLVVDKRQHIAGNAYDSEDEAGVRVHRYGAHIFHTKSERVWQYLAPFTDWLPYVHRVQSSVDGQLVPMPCNLDTLVALLGPDHAAKVTKRLHAIYGLEARVPVLNLLQNEEEDLRAVGELIYEKLFLQYTVKQWGMKPEDLDRSVTGRVPVVLTHGDTYFTDPFQGIPADGYTAMVSRMLDHPNITVELDCEYLTLSDELRQLPTVYTGPIDEYFSFSHGPLPYRSLRFENRTVHSDRVQPVAVINHPDLNPYTRVIEHAHFSDQHLGWSTLTYEFPEAHERGSNEPYYPIPRPDNHRLYSLYSEEADKLAGRVYFVGRLAEYRYYDMDQAIAHALALFDHTIAVGARARTVA